MRFLAYLRDSDENYAVRHDTIEEFNVDRKTESVQLNLAHVARKKVKKTKQTYANAHLVRYRLRSVKAVEKEPERL